MNESTTEYHTISREHLDGVLALCEEEGWASYTADAKTTWEALTAPGVTTVVAVAGSSVVGFAQMQSDGLIQAHLSLIVVSRAHRKRGIGRRLVEKALARSGGKRLDLVTDDAGGFYESFTHKKMQGYRIYPAN